jgi:lipopolysaccharide biosynthesis protein
MRRCAVYLFYDRDGIVDEYNIFLLKEIKKHVENILVVCNGFLNECGKKKFETVANEVLIRDNIGMDVGGYKEGIAYIGYEELSKYDEIILMNYTFFGPLYPFSEMFSTMEKIDVDFWGITCHGKVTPDPFGCIPFGYLPRHIQSYFLVLRHKLFISDDFQTYWKNLSLPVKYTDSIVNFEAVFTKTFEDKGYNWTTYIDTEDMEERSVCPVMYYARELIEEKRCPIVKRRIFFHDYIDLFTNTCGESYQLAYRYIKDYLGYDVNLIWDNILRLENMTDINKALHLNYFLSAKNADVKGETAKVTAIFYFNDEKQIPYHLQYINSLPKDSKIYFICTAAEIKERLEKFELAFYQYEIHIYLDSSWLTWDDAIRKIPEEWIKENELICLVNASGTGQGLALSNISSWREKNLKSILASKAYVQNIIQTFENEPRLGVLSPFKPIHGIYYEEIEKEWQEKSDDVKKILSLSNCSYNLSVEKIPIAPFAGACWIRMPVLKKICSLEISDIHLKSKEYLSVSTMACSIPFLAQSIGYYSGWLFCNDYCEIDFTNMDYMVRETNKAVFKRWCPGLIQDLAEIIENDNGVVPLNWKRKLKNQLKKRLPFSFYQLGKDMWHKLKRYRE